MTDAERDIVAAWSLLGICWNVPPVRKPPDPERLIIRSLSIIPVNPRMLVLMASWLSVYWRCIGRDRLCVLAQATPVREQAALGIALETADSWLATPVFAQLRLRLVPMQPPEPLFEGDRQRPALARLAEMEASPISRRWGLWCLPVERKLDAIRPAEWVLGKWPALRIRSVFKGSLKTSLLSAIEAAGPAMPSVSQLARECGVTRKAVYEAMDDLRFSGVIGDAADAGITLPPRPARQRRATGRGPRSLPPTPAG